MQMSRHPRSLHILIWERVAYFCQVDYNHDFTLMRYKYNVNISITCLYFNSKGQNVLVGRLILNSDLQCGKRKYKYTNSVE